MKVATHIAFAECCWFASSSVFDVHYGTSTVPAVAAISILPDADYPKSWIGHQLGSISEDLNRLFGHRSFLHSLLALLLVTATLGLFLWWISDSAASVVAVFVGYGSHLLADMMTLGGVQLFWPSRLIAVFPGRDEYRVVRGGNSERVFVAFALTLALLFYPVSRVGFDGLIYRMGGDDQLYGEVTRTSDGDTITVETQGRTTPVRLIGVDTPETVAPDQPIGCYGKEASEYTKEVLEDRLVRLEIPRVGGFEDTYKRTLAYVYLDTDRDGTYEHLFKEDLITLGLARTTTFSHANRHEFERLREEAEERGAGLWGACPEVALKRAPPPRLSLMNATSAACPAHPPRRRLEAALKGRFATAGGPGLCSPDCGDDGAPFPRGGADRSASYATLTPEPHVPVRSESATQPAYVRRLASSMYKPESYMRRNFALLGQR